jgi:hypothetical protein
VSLRSRSRQPQQQQQQQQQRQKTHATTTPGHTPLSDPTSGGVGGGATGGGTTGGAVGLEALPVQQAHDAMFRASVMGLFAPRGPSAGAPPPPPAPSAPPAPAPSSSSSGLLLPAVGPATTITAGSAAAGLSAEVESAKALVRGVPLEAFCDRFHRIAAFAALEIEHAGRGGGPEEEVLGGRVPGAAAGASACASAPSAASQARMAALAREWLVLNVASSRHAPSLVEMAEAYDMQQRRLAPYAERARTSTQGQFHAAADDEEERTAFEQRSARALAAALLSPAQRQAVADAFAFFQSETRGPLRDWRRAAQELDAAIGGGGGGGGSSNCGLQQPLELLSSAVARCLVARSAFYLSVVSTITPRQLLSAVVAVYPRCLRPVNIAWPALQAEQQQQQEAAASARPSP